MQDTNLCPICNSKLYSISNTLIHPRSNKTMQRQCRSGHNHYMLFYSDPITKAIDWMKLSLTTDNSIYLELHFKDNMTIIRGMNQSNETMKIVIPKIIDPDFPKLTELKEKIKMYVSLS